MARAFIKLGDSTSHGGTVTEASTTMRSEDGRGYARVGDAVSCPIHGSTTITTGDPTFILDDRPIARDGDETDCGATLQASQCFTTVSSESPASDQTAEHPHQSAVNHDDASPQHPNTDKDHRDTFNRLFQVIDQDGAAVSGIAVTLATPDGQTTHEQTNADGITPAVSGHRGEQAELTLFRGAE